MPRYLLIKNAELYAPEPMGQQDILIIGEQVAQVEKAVVRTVEFETARANVVRQSQALDEMHRKVVQETLRVAAARTVRGVAGPRAKAQEKGSRTVRLGRRRLKGAQG